MSAYLIQHTFHDFDDLAKDRYVNTFHALYTGTGSPDDTAFSQLIGPIVTFFDSASANTGLRNFIAQHARGPGATVKVYDESQPIPRTPVSEYTYNPTDSGTTFQPMPAEVALCISFRGGLISGINPQRMRGRIYIGPLNTSTQAAGVAGAARPALATTVWFAYAYNQLITNMLTGPWELVQHSKVRGVYQPIQRIWCDNAYDTQRRRGLAATARTTIDVF